MAYTNAQRQARWASKRNALARVAEALRQHEAIRETTKEGAETSKAD
jgi:hypothetical protein